MREPVSTGDTDTTYRLRMLADAQLSLAIQVVATLGVADHIDREPQPADELARRTSCHQDALHRLLRYLAFAGVFVEAADGRYGLTGMGRLLRSDEPGTLRRELSIGTDHRALWWSTGELLHSVRTGKPAYDRVFGQSFWQTVGRDTNSSTRFQQGMVEDSDDIAESLLCHYDWPSVDVLADLGGGSGRVLARFLQAHAGMRGYVVDLPAVTAEARQTLANAGVGDRGDVVEGDLLEEVPSGADRYLLMRVLHDWPDDAAVTILRNARTACRDTGRVLIVDMEVGSHDRVGASYVSDIMMLLLLGGRERSAPEFNELLSAAGLELTRRIELRSPYVVIEAVPAALAS
jgi:hypothetical protein